MRCDRALLGSHDYSVGTEARQRRQTARQRAERRSILRERGFFILICLTAGKVVFTTTEDASIDDACKTRLKPRRQVRAWLEGLAYAVQGRTCARAFVSLRIGPWQRSAAAFLSNGTLRAQKSYGEPGDPTKLCGHRGTAARRDSRKH